MLTADQQKVLDKQLIEQTEGKLYLHIFVMVMNSSKGIFAHHYYVVRNGIVYSISRKKPAGLGVKDEEVDNTLVETPSGDNLLELVSQCKCLGNYDETLIIFKDHPVVDMEHLEKRYLDKLKK